MNDVHFVLFQGEKPAWFSVVASKLLPVHITTLSSADVMYEKHAGQEFFKVREAGAVMSFWWTVPPGDTSYLFIILTLLLPQTGIVHLDWGQGVVLVLAATFLHTLSVHISDVTHKKAAGLSQQLVHVAHIPSLLIPELWASLGWVALDVIPVLLFANWK